MLINPTPVKYQDPIIELMREMHGGLAVTKLYNGIYEIGHFNGKYEFEGKFEDYPSFEQTNEDEYLGAYGVCDNYQQILDKYPELMVRDRKFFVTLCKVTAAEEESPGGWRWHKWGTYIGTHDPQYEYIADETGIEFVYCYHIYEVL